MWSDQGMANGEWRMGGRIASRPRVVIKALVHASRCASHASDAIASILCRAEGGGLHK